MHNFARFRQNKEVSLLPRGIIYLNKANKKAISAAIEESDLPMRIDRILIVDDDDALRRMLVDYLTSEGYTALGMRTVQQGQEAVRNDPFDLVIADLRLENGSGLDLLRQ